MRLLPTFLSILYFTAGSMPLTAQASDAPQKKYFVMQGSISDTSLLKGQVFIEIHGGSENIITDTVATGKDKNMPDRYFTLKHPQSDSIHGYRLYIKEKIACLNRFLFFLY